MWMIRAGEGGRLIEEFRRCGCAALGWTELGDLTPLRTVEGVRECYHATYPDDRPARAAGSVAMVHKFRSVVRRGERVVAYDPERRVYHVGRVTSDYRFEPGRVDGCAHLREVAWEGEVGRDWLSAPARNVLGSPLPLFSVPDDVRGEILEALDASRLIAEREEARTAEEAPRAREELSLLWEELRGRAHELIKDRILTLGPDEMEALVAALLRAMGYRARVTPKGPDRGVDVFASPDGLGLEEPRVKAEVKHRRDRIGSPEVRAFLGVLRQGDRGLYVSTGGFTQDARYEAERAPHPVTLVDLDDLASLVATHYDGFDVEGRTLIPLVRVHWPVD